MYKFDTHVHTSEVSSCSGLTAVETLKIYKEKNYDGVVITDHYADYYFVKMTGLPWESQVAAFLQGYNNALEYGKTIGITVLFGIELRLAGSGNEYLLYGMTPELCVNLPEMYNYTLEQLRDVTKKHNVAVFQAHPFRNGMVAITSEFMDGCEVYNGNPRHNSHNDSSDEFATQNGLHKLSGSDCHQPEDAARGGVIINKHPLTSRELIDEVIAGNARLIKDGVII